MHAGQRAHSQCRALPVSNPPLLLCRSLANLVLFTTPQFAQLYKWVPCYRRWWKCEWRVFVQHAAWLNISQEKASCCRSEQVCQGVKCEAFWSVQLPVKQRVTYKILLLTFRALNGLAPIYIVDMLHCHRPARALRSANNNDLRVPSTSSRYGDRAFAVSAPRLWNALPCELKTATSLISFKRLLNTHLFRMAYEQ